MFHTFALFFFTILGFSTFSSAVSRRRLLHQPFIPVDQIVTPPSISQPPFSSPSPQQQQPPLKYPFSYLYPPNTATVNPFFPFSAFPPPPPPSADEFSTFPANISSLVLPSSPASPHKPIKLILVLAVSLLSLLIFASVFLLLRSFYRRRHLKAEKHPLFPPNTAPSDTTPSSTVTKNPPFPRYTGSSNSSEFLYLGTLVSSRDANAAPSAVRNSPLAAASSLNYQRLGSPELHPLPPLPRDQSYRSGENTYLNFPSEEYENTRNGNGEEEFFSPKQPTEYDATPFPPRISGDNEKGRIFNSNSSRNSVSSDGSPSVVLNSSSPQSIESKSPDSLMNFPGPPPRFAPHPPSLKPRVYVIFSPSDGETAHCSPDFSGAKKAPPPPQPPPAAQSELTAPISKRKEWKSDAMNSEIGREGTVKPKLKPLHWDKVKTSSNKAMIWDQMKSSSFQLNEEMIETLFVVNSSNVNSRNGGRHLFTPDSNQENQVLDPKKSQNIAILLRALNVTVNEVCEALIEGNADALGAELLESLLKMAPTKEEERRLKDGSPFKLGIAETFLKSLLDIPFAFKRVDAMLYIAIFESEIKYLNRTFDTLESACNELKSSRMFRKLLEAVLKTGNRMNQGTNRGDAHAFKLDSLLKLIDVKGADGKTTLLHFVVQEIIRTEGARLSSVENNSVPATTLRDEVEYRKIGLQVVSGLSGELTNVKKAASMEADVLCNDVSNLATGVAKINDVLKLNQEFALENNSAAKFSNQMSMFLSKAEPEIVNVQAKEGIALSMVKGLTEFFHGGSAKEEARPLRLFIVVKDFLATLDRVCKDVCKMNERTMVNSNSSRHIRAQANPSLDQVFPGLGQSQQLSSSSDEESSSHRSFSIALGADV